MNEIRDRFELIYERIETITEFWDVTLDSEPEFWNCDKEILQQFLLQNLKAICNEMGQIINDMIEN